MLNLLTLAGEHCERLLETHIQNVSVHDSQLDEIFGYVQKKEGHKHPNEADVKEIGDAYTFIGLERNTKLVVEWHLGMRDRVNTEQFLEMVRKATAATRFEVCTDAFIP